MSDKLRNCPENEVILQSTIMYGFRDSHVMDFTEILWGKFSGAQTKIIN
jgi:hypothetical protein